MIKLPTQDINSLLDSLKNHKKSSYIKYIAYDRFTFKLYKNKQPLLTLFIFIYFKDSSYDLLLIDPLYINNVIEVIEVPIAIGPIESYVTGEIKVRVTKDEYKCLREIPSL